MDSNTPIWPENLPVPNVNPRRDINPLSIQTEMESSRLRNRRMALQHSETIEVNWNFTRDEFDIFRSFFKDDLENGALSFLLPLMGFEEEIEQEVIFVGNPTFARSDNLFSVNAKLQIFEDGVYDSNTDLPTLDKIIFRKFDGPPYQILPFGGYIYVCGRFTSYGDDEVGWKPCKGIARILDNGELDETFMPGGVSGGGFDIVDGYFAPTQMQGAKDGGVFVGCSFAWLAEPLLYDRRSDSTVTDRMSLNGIEVPPLIKLKSNGELDTGFVTDYLKDAATNPKFSSFHMHEIANICYVTYNVDVTSTEKNTSASFSGLNRPVLEWRTLDGTFKRRAWRNTDFGITGLSYADTVLLFQQCYFDDANGILHWAGQETNSLGGGLLISDPNDSEVCRPYAWKMADLEYSAAIPGIISFTPFLTFNEACNWAGYTVSGMESDLFTTMVPYNINRGCFLGSLVGSVRVVGDSGALPEEGSWASGDRCRHKGCLHFNFKQAFGNGIQLYSGNGDSLGFSITNFEQEGVLRGYGTYKFGPGTTLFELWYNLDGDNEDEVTSFTAGEKQHPVGPYTPSVPGKSYAVTALDVDSGSPAPIAEWELYFPRERPFVFNPTDLWDLRNASDPGNTDTSIHGFDPFSGAVTDSDGCHNMRILRAMHDPNSTSATLSTSPNLGVFLAGHIEKFRGVTVHTKPEQLIKIRHNGQWDSVFAPPEFGPESFNLKEDISSGADELHYCKINCAIPSPGGNYLYVGGKFTQLVEDGNTIEVGFIACLDINTGRIAT